MQGASKCLGGGSFRILSSTSLKKGSLLLSEDLLISLSIVYFKIKVSELVLKTISKDVNKVC